MADEQIVDTVVDDDKAVTEDDLRSLKYDNEEVEVAEATDETSEAEEASEDTEETEIGETEEASKDETEEPSFVKQFPQIKGDTPEEYAKNLEKAYENSTAEAMRLRKPPDTETEKTEEVLEAPNTDITSLYAKQKMDEEITQAWTAFQKQYPQVTDQTEYDNFTRTVAELSNTILQSQKRLATPEELYRKAAGILEWTPEEVTKEDKLKTAVKDAAASSKSSTGTKGKPVSKVTDAMLAANRKMYPGKSDQEIREELEPYVN